ncbi:hypothetical protein J3R30DRAFT_3473954 [Lentinula aciculospora]|uniref:Fe2OG dioxygenase domain-containing protein n=1 Tax=Lentinula aciculospora TaxID=153920 RepID=A0A9W9AEC0_9AGAR|nr:hypothetical protein J3R30DRAFT_3473954 [Lentinula aciculospora]
MPGDGLTSPYNAPGSNTSSRDEMKRKLIAVNFEDIVGSDSQKQEGRSNKRTKLHIEIPAPKADPNCCTGNHDEDSETFSSLSPDSLFDEALAFPNLTTTQSPPVLLQPNEEAQAALTAPPIPGLFFDPSLKLPEDLAKKLAGYCMSTYFDGDEGKRKVNQVMLFERAPVDDEDSASGSDTSSDRPSTGRSTSTGIPPQLLALLDKLSVLLRPPVLPLEIYQLLFPSSVSHPAMPRTVPSNSSSTLTTAEKHPKPAKQARQAILNLYTPGEGISPHVDLLRRYGDGIIGVSLCGGCVMRFERVRDEEFQDLSQRSHSSLTSIESMLISGSDFHELYLPPNSVIVLSGDARYKWTHGIERRIGDWVLQNSDEDSEDILKGDGNKEVQAEWIRRETRLSITFRWLLPGADVVGGDEL